MRRHQIDELDGRFVWRADGRWPRLAASGSGCGESVLPACSRPARLLHIRGSTRGTRPTQITEAAFDPVKRSIAQAQVGGLAFRMQTAFARSI